MRHAIWIVCLSLSSACSDANRPVAVQQPPPKPAAESTSAASPAKAPAATKSESSASNAKPDASAQADALADVAKSGRHGAGLLEFRAQEGWTKQTPANPMRVAQFALPRAESDAEDAELVVFHFGAAGGGGFDMNLERWASQMQQPDGSDSSAKISHTQRKVGEVAIREAWVGGTFVAETTPGSGQRLNKPDFKLRAAMLEVPGTTPYYVKLTGPAKTVDRWDSAWNAFLTSAGQSVPGPAK